jgi:hypothetical protein
MDMRIPSFLVAVGTLVLLGAPNPVAAQTDSTNAPRALRELLADASRRNVLPPALISFRSNVETEISVLLRREEGTEAVTAVEQVASTLKWNRTGFYDQRIVGYRAQQMGPNVSMQVSTYGLSRFVNSIDEGGVVFSCSQRPVMGIPNPPTLT